jgi:hypothetical protein
MITPEFQTALEVPWTPAFDRIKTVSKRDPLK